MALINHRAREIHFKIVYYGPGLGGKTTNLKILHDRLPPERRGKMISIATDHERTLFFDFLPLDLGQVNGFSTRFHLYTVPGQVYYRLSRRAVLQGVDGVVFVADSHPAREEANRESLADLGEHLGTLGLTPTQLVRMPRVFQYNKRDLAGALPVERMHALLNPGGALEFEAVASDGRGVNDTLKAVCKLVLARLTSEPATESTGPMPILVMRRPGKAQMVKMAADAAAAEAAATSRSESAAIAAGTMPLPVPPVATAAPGAVAQAPRPAYAQRPIIAPPRPLDPRPALARAPIARPLAAATSARAAVAEPPARPAMPSPSVATPAPARAPATAPATGPALAPAPMSAPARPAPESRPRFRWPWPARFSHPANASQAQAPAPPSATPVPAAIRASAPPAPSVPAPPAPAPASVQPVAAAPAPPRPSVQPVAAAPAPPPVAATPPPVAPRTAPPVASAPPLTAPQPAASRMMWGRPPRPAGRRGGPPFAGARTAQTSLAFPQPAPASTPAPTNGAPARPDPGRPAAEARPPAPATEPA